MADRLVAIAGNWDDALQRPRWRVISSTDALIWDPVEGPISDVVITALTSVEGVAWAVGQVRGPIEPEHQVWRSENGLDWRRVATTGLDLGSAGIVRIAGSGSSLVAIAWPATGEGPGGGILLASDDGQEWVQVKQPREPAYGIRSITGDSAGFVLVHAFEGPGAAQFGDAWLSADGRRWTDHPIDGPRVTLNFSEVAAGPGGYAAVGITEDRRAVDFAAAAWFSPNGMIWEPARIIDPSGFQPGRMQYVVSVGPSFASFGSTDALGDETASAWISADGRGWGRLTGWPVRAREYIDGAVFWNDRVVVTGEAQDGAGSPRPVVWIGEAAN